MGYRKGEVVVYSNYGSVDWTMPWEKRRKYQVASKLKTMDIYEITPANTLNTVCYSGVRTSGASLFNKTEYEQAQLINLLKVA